MLSVCFCFLNSDPLTICSPFLCVSTTSRDNFVRQHPPSSTPIITSTSPTTAAASAFSSSSFWLSLYKSLCLSRHNYKATVETFKVSQTVEMPMFMNSCAEQTWVGWGFSKIRMFAKTHCKSAPRGNGPRASRAQVVTCRCWEREVHELQIYWF